MKFSAQCETCGRLRPPDVGEGDVGVVGFSSPTFSRK